MLIIQCVEVNDSMFLNTFDYVKDNVAKILVENTGSSPRMDEDTHGLFELDL